MLASCGAPGSYETGRRKGLGILGELDRAGLIDTSVGNVLRSTLDQTLAAHDIARPGPDGAPGSGVSRAVRTRYLAAPAGVRTTVM